MIPYNDEVNVDARSEIKGFAHGRRGHEAYWLLNYERLERGLPTPGLDLSDRHRLETIRSFYLAKERRNGSNSDQLGHDPVSPRMDFDTC
jgi:hypothetical protein